ncbi:TIGR00730 family Rossman fold protein, partial [Streptomyces abyssomicinicus]|uniref:LOG family protein n=1 Tax=Streptomyces abyssomicinicus TaxID=574929 RepID=UPI001250B046
MRRSVADFGAYLADQGITLVHGGGRVGLMSEIADAVVDAGGKAIGVMPRHLVDRELAHDRLTKLHIVDTLHERKARMTELADAFVALPGGPGTLDEFFEAWTWGQLGLHRKPLRMCCSAVFARRRQASAPGSGGIASFHRSGWDRWQPVGHQRSLMTSRCGKENWALR